MKSTFIKSTIFSVSIVFTGTAIAVDENTVNNVMQEVKEKTLISGEQYGIYGVHLGMTYGEAKAHALKTARYPNERDITKKIGSIKYVADNPGLNVSMGFENSEKDSPARNIYIERYFELNTNVDRMVLIQDLNNKFGEPTKNGDNRVLYYHVPGPGRPDVKAQCDSELAKKGFSRLEMLRASPRALTNVGNFGYQVVREILEKCPSALETYKAFIISHLAPRMVVNLNGKRGPSRNITFTMSHEAPKAFETLEALEVSRKAREAKGPARL